LATGRWHRLEAAEGVNEARLSADGTRLLFLSRANFTARIPQRLQAL
jgi:hypothetical protein